MIRTNKQGVPILDSVGTNGNKSRTAYCSHFAAAEWQVVGRTYVMSELQGIYEREILGKKCIHCGEILETANG